MNLFVDCAHSVLFEATRTVRGVVADWFARLRAGEDVVARSTKVAVGEQEGEGEEHQSHVDFYKAELERRMGSAAAGTALRIAPDAPWRRRRRARLRAVARFLFVVPPLAGHVNPTVAVGRELAARGHERGLDRPPRGGARAASAPTPAFLPVADAVPPEVLEAVVERSAGPAGPGGAAVPVARRAVPLAHTMLPGVHAAVDACPARRRSSSTSRPWPGRRWPSVRRAAVGHLGHDVGRADRPAGHDGQGRRLGAGADPGYLVAAGLARRRRGPHRPPVLAPPAAGLHDGRARGRHRRSRRRRPSSGRRSAARPDTTPFPWEWLDDRRPLVLVSLGTLNWQDGERFFARAVEALGALDVQGVVVAPPDMVGTAPRPTWSCAPGCPQLALLARTAAVVSHGGHNTVCEALAHGLPLVVAPIRDDQPIVAEQVVAAGAGVRVRVRPGDGSRVCGPPSTAVLTDPDLRAAAAPRAGVVRRRRRCSGRRRHLEQLVGGGRAGRAAARRRRHGRGGRMDVITEPSGDARRPPTPPRQVAAEALGRDVALGGPPERDPRLVRPGRLRLPPRARRRRRRGTAAVVVRVTSPHAPRRARRPGTPSSPAAGYPVPPVLGPSTAAHRTGARAWRGVVLGQGPSLSLMEASASTRSPSRSCCGRWPRRTPALHRVPVDGAPAAAAGERRWPPSTARSPPRASPPEFAAERAWLDGHARPRPVAGRVPRRPAARGDAARGRRPLDGHARELVARPGGRRRVRRRPHAPHVLVGARTSPRAWASARC